MQRSSGRTELLGQVRILDGILVPNALEGERHTTILAHNELMSEWTKCGHAVKRQ